MLKNFLSIAFRLYADLFAEFRKLLWKVKSGFSKLSVDKNHAYYFGHYGDITRMVFTRQHLVRFNKSFEFETVNKFIEFVKEGDVVFDIGANVGVYSLLSSDLVGESGHVYSFEPSHDTYKMLLENVELNKRKNIKLEQIALSDSEGEVAIGVSALSTMHEYNDAFNHMQMDSTAYAKEDLVPMNTLDNYCIKNNIKDINFIKIDIEGAELLCLRGGLEVIKKFKPIIVFEMEDSFCERFNYSCMDLLIFLHDLNYKLKRFDGFNWVATPQN